METALSTISILPSTKEQVMKFVGSLKHEILASDKNPLPILVQLQAIKSVIEKILVDEEIEYHFLKEFLLYDKNEKVTVNGAELRQSEVGVKYDYSASGDPVWNDLENQISELNEKKKEREKFLQNIPYDAGIVDPGTGLFISRPPKSSKTKVIVKL